jgi:hypothetical protein
MFFLLISIQTGTRVFEYVRVGQCHRAYNIEQTFAAILYREAPAASCRLHFLGPFKEK